MRNFNSPKFDSSDEWCEPYFTPAPPKMLDVPVSGSIEIFDGFPPRIRFAGTLWRFRICGPSPDVLTHHQLVTIIGRQGNSLLVKI